MTLERLAALRNFFDPWSLEELKNLRSDLPRIDKHLRHHDYLEGICIIIDEREATKLPQEATA